jgi:hypothetical protein
VNQLFEPPSQATVHEFYHLLGCPHALSLSKCYHLIAALKTHIDPAQGFIPGIASDGGFLLTRTKANAVMRSAMAYEDARRQGATPDQAQVVKQTSACETNPATRVGQDVQDSAAEISVPNRRRTMVCLCVDEAGMLTQDPMIAASSGNPKMDDAANTIAKGASGQYHPPMVDDKPAAGCFQLAITFRAQKPE